MTEIFGVEIDFVSLTPAVFAALLSIYNWLQANKPANIHPGNIVNYGFISSSHENCMLFCFPLVFENTGAKKGVITDIKMGFKTNNEIKYIDVDLRVRLNELKGAMIPSMDYDKFTDEAYVILLPTYPIVVEGGESITTTIISTVEIDKGLVPIDKDAECVIVVFFGKGKSNKKSIPFYLTKDNAESDDVLLWLKPKE